MYVFKQSESGITQAGIYYSWEMLIIKPEMSRWIFRYLLLIKTKNISIQIKYTLKGVHKHN